MILVDTSVWINYFSGIENEKVKFLTEALSSKKEIFLTDIILTEILQGIKEDNKYKIVKNILLSLPFVHAKNFETFIHASDIYRKCRANGITVRKTIDCLIAAVSIENNLEILTEDVDFYNISKVIDIGIIIS